MPQEVSTNDLFKRLGNKARKSHENHIEDAPPTVFVDLPGGIKNGRAKLTMLKLGEYKSGDNKGQPFFMAQATVIAPTHHNGMRVQGLLTKIGPEALCDTPKVKSEKGRKTFDQHYSWMLGQLKLLGMADDVEFEDLPEEFERLLEEAPVIAFQTREWSSSKDREPMVFHTWLGVVDEEGVEIQDSVEDQTGDLEETADDTSEEGDDNGSSDEEEAGDEGEDLEALGSAADAGDKEAKKRLNVLALEDGWTQKEVNEVATWSELAESLLGATDEDKSSEEESQAEGDEEGETGEESKFKDGNVFLYHPIHPKTKQPAKDPVEVILQNVDLDEGVADLERTDTGKVVMSVPLTKLKEVEE